jgi:hypothetical protein
VVNFAQLVGELEGLYQHDEHGSFDIYVATLETKNDGWGQPVNLGIRLLLTWH